MSALAWPVAHIANIGWLAVLVNVVLVVVFGVVAAGRRRGTGDATRRNPVASGSTVAG